MTLLEPGAAIGFVGLGNMGLPMASRLVAAGYDVRAFDADEAARARFADAAGVEAAPTLAAAGTDVAAVVLMLPSSAVVHAVVLDDGLLDRLAPGTLLIDMSSSDPTRTRELAAVVGGQRRLKLVDAPVSGGVSGARAGTLTIMVGGDSEAVAACRPLLEILGASVLHVGETGSGHALKALNNLLSATTLLITSEAMAIARRFGLDPQVALDAINASSGRSWSTEHKLPRFVLPGTFDSGFALRLMLKDMHIAGDLARETGAPALLGEAAIQAWEQAAEALPDGADHTEIARWVEARAADDDAAQGR